MALEPQAPVADPEPLAALARAVRRFWWVVVLVMLLAVGAAALKLSARTSDYRASAQLLILPLPQYDQTFLGTSLLRDGGDPKLTAATAAQIVHSRAIAADASARLGGRPAADSVLASVSVTPSTDANVLRVSAQDGRRAGAVRLANAYVAAVLVERWRTISPELERRLAALESRRSQLGAGTGTGTGTGVDADGRVCGDIRVHADIGIDGLRHRGAREQRRERGRDRERGQLACFPGHNVLRSSFPNRVFPVMAPSHGAGR
jgi:hypothetical protein